MAAPLDSLVDAAQAWADASGHSATGAVRLFNLAPLMCSGVPAGGTCGAHVPGTSVAAYQNKDHLSLAGAEYLWPYLCSAFGVFVE